MDRKVGDLPYDPSQTINDIIWVKIVGLGNAGAGKTCLIKHFCESNFSPGYQPTVGVDYGFKIQRVKGIDLRVHLWDLSGHPDYGDVRNELYNNTDAVFIAYDVTDKASFDSVKTWQEELQRYGSMCPDLALVANKSDLKSKRQVAQPTGKKLANQSSWNYHETSCQTGEGVMEMFEQLLTSVMRRKGII